MATVTKYATADDLKNKFARGEITENELQTQLSGLGLPTLSRINLDALKTSGTTSTGTPAGARKTSEQLMADVVEMYSGQGAYEKLYESNKAKFMADTLARLGPSMAGTTRPAAISAGYEREVGPQFAAQKIGMKAGAMTNLASLLEARNTLDKQLTMQEQLTKMGISSQEQQTKWGIESQEKLAEKQRILNLQLAQMGIISQEKITGMGIAGQQAATGMQVASQQGINAANIASSEKTAQLSAQTALQVAGMQYPVQDTSNLSTYRTGYQSVINPTPTQKLTQPTVTQPTTSAYGPRLTNMGETLGMPKANATGYQTYQTVMSNLGLGQW